MLSEANNQTAPSPTVAAASEAAKSDATSAGEAARKGKPVSLVSSPLGKLLSSLTINMAACLPCAKADPNRETSKVIEKQLSQWSKKESKVIQLLLIGRRAQHLPLYTYS